MFSSKLPLLLLHTTKKNRNCKFHIPILTQQQPYGKRRFSSTMINTNQPPELNNQSNAHHINNNINDTILIQEQEEREKRRKLFGWYSTSHNPLSIDATDSLFSHDHNDHVVNGHDDGPVQLEKDLNMGQFRKKQTDLKQVYEWMDGKESEMFGFLNEKHLEPRDRTDRWAQWWARRCVARILKFLFGRNMLRYSIFLETMSATPGMVGGMWRHFASLRSKPVDRCKKEHLRVGALLEEAENHRMHMLVLLEMSHQNILERILMVIAQLSFSQYYFYIYSLAGKTFSHRFVGYLAETAVESYGLVLKQIDEKKIPNPPAPEIAINYWNLPKNSTLRDVILSIRMDECKHREFNHALSDELYFEKIKNKN